MKHTHNSNYPNDLPDHAEVYPDVTRIEVIGDGREYSTWDAKEVWIALQDDGRTLKVFKKPPTRTFEEHDRAWKDRVKEKEVNWIAKRILSEHKKYAKTMDDEDTWAHIAAAKIAMSLLMLENK